MDGRMFDGMLAALITIALVFAAVAFGLGMLIGWWLV